MPDTGPKERDTSGPTAAMAEEDESASGVAGVSPAAEWPFSLVIAAVALMPFVALVHEIGHWLLARYFGVPGLRLGIVGVNADRGMEFKDHVLQGDLATAATIYPPHEQTLIAAAGPAATVMLLAAVAVLIVRRRMTPVLAVIALLAGYRGASLLWRWYMELADRVLGLASYRLPRTGDEVLIAALTEIPLPLLERNSPAPDAAEAPR